MEHILYCCSHRAPSRTRRLVPDSQSATWSSNPPRLRTRNLPEEDAEFPIDSLLWKNEVCNLEQQSVPPQSAQRAPSRTRQILAGLLSRKIDFCNLTQRHVPPPNAQQLSPRRRRRIPGWLLRQNDFCNLEQQPVPPPSAQQVSSRTRRPVSDLFNLQSGEASC